MSPYDVLLILHLAAMVAWFAGLFYLPRLFVYHLENLKNAQMAKVFLTMEKRLLRVIMRPAAVVTLLAGLGLVVTEPFVLQQGWLHAKLGLVLLLLAYHGSLEYTHLLLRANRPTKSSRFFRLYNEVPTLLLLAILTLAVAKPF
jgi:putative membrane protein